MKLRTFLEALLLLFIGLKLAGFITWPWWLVFAPAWVPLLVAFPLLVLSFFIAALKGARRESRR